MGKKLFLICPFSRLEGFLQSHYGEVYFMTAPAAVFSAVAAETQEYLPDFVQAEGITDIYLVSDAGCPFIEAAIEREPSQGLACEETISRISGKETSPFEIARQLVIQQLAFLAERVLPDGEKRIPPVHFHGLVSYRAENLISTVA